MADILHCVNTFSTIAGFIMGAAGLWITICSFRKIKSIDERIRDKKILLNVKKQIPEWLLLIDSIINEKLLQEENVEYSVKLKVVLHNIITYADSFSKKQKVAGIAQEMIDILNEKNGGISDDKLIKLRVELDKEKTLIED